MKKHNFSAGPCILPQEVFQKSAEAVLDFNGIGLSLLEISHRSKDFIEVMDEARAIVKRLMKLGDDYDVLYLGGGASLQFVMVPFNLMKVGGKAAYTDTGTWAAGAIKEAKRLGQVDIVGSSKEENYSFIPKDYTVGAEYDYFHCTSNNTIFGTQMKSFPKVGTSLVCDMSSDIFSREIDFSQFDLIYAGAQKNIGPAGVTVVIVREDFLNDQPQLSAMLDYRIQAEAGSLYNTPPCFNIYISKLVFDWVKNEIGGVDKMAEIQREKSGLLYNYIESSDFYTNPVKYEKDRSVCNIPFVTPSKELDAKFVAEADALGFKNIKGHRSVGGMRASVYNAFPRQGVLDLIDFMKKFEAENK